MLLILQTTFSKAEIQNFHYFFKKLARFTKEIKPIPISTQSWNGKGYIKKLKGQSVFKKLFWAAVEPN